MLNGNDIEGPGFAIKFPNSDNWRFRIGSKTHPALLIQYYVENPPCWFHRKMQAWLLGIYWEKI